MAEHVSASEALVHFENSFANEPEKAAEDIPVVQLFIDWFGSDRLMSELTGSQVADYAKNHTSGQPEALEPLRAFLAHASRLALTEVNLVPFLKLGPAAGGARGGQGANQDLGGKAFYVTLDGLKFLEQHLAEEKAKRPLIAEKLREAMADKDFRENAPLDAARDEQGHLEARIRDLEEKLRNAVIIDEDAKGGRANVGSFVRMLNLSTEKEQAFTLVSPAEVDPKNGKISIQSPVGVAVQNRLEGDEVMVNAPSGSFPFRILEIRG
ncbi:MAG: transcription elongation factor GreA [Chloroflexi bacterium]|nr:transcription elongation factor GreA [Chloroflexota bacterium]MDA1240045.1 transcription elongation factor GreA [Chloroflexota bacterium]MQC25569.1 transcription elongation factor GreA [Chloroflexota bacterium]MQC48219.1 transcription elongation factor GreA [Chloroflexota bacterium]